MGISRSNAKVTPNRYWYTPKGKNINAFFVNKTRFVIKNISIKSFKLFLKSSSSNSYNLPAQRILFIHFLYSTISK